MSLNLVVVPEGPSTKETRDIRNYGLRRCTDEEYGLQKRCFYCKSYSFKSWSDEDNNSGKCFGTWTDESRAVNYVDGQDICNLFRQDAPDPGPDCN